MAKNKKEINSIKLCIYFHTGDGGLHLPPKTAFKGGAVIMPTNHKHGIRASEAGRSFFGDSQGSLIDAIQDCLRKNGIKLVDQGKIGEYKKFLKMKEEGKFFDETYNV